MELYTAEKGSFPDMLVPPFGPHLTGFVLDAVVHFVGAVTEGKPVLATGEDGLLQHQGDRRHDRGRERRPGRGARPVR